MKLIATILLLFTTTLTATATRLYSSLVSCDTVISFEYESTVHGSLIIIDANALNNRWQIGTPQKITFTAAHLGLRAIATDTTQHCVPGDSSVFYVKFDNKSICNPTSSALGGIGFVHKLDIDAGSIARVEQLLYNSTTDDSVWIDMMALPYGRQWTDGCYGICDTPDLTKPVTNWDTVSAYLGYKYQDHPMHNNVLPNDSVLFRFTYISNDTSLTRDGWIIDNIWPNYDFFGGNVEQTGATRQVSIYPNPGNGDIMVRIPTFKSQCNVVVCDMQGRVVYKYSLQIGDSDLKLSLSPGIYMLKYTVDDYNNTERIVVTD
jgi:hypothetical protein